MANWRKVIILSAVALLAFLALLGVISAREQARWYVYSGTTQSSNTFVADRTGAYGYVVDSHTGAQYFFVINEDAPNGRSVLSISSDQDCSGTFPVKQGHTYYMWTDPGELEIPGNATCYATNAQSQPSGQDP